MKKTLMCVLLLATLAGGCLIENGGIVDETTDAGVDASAGKCIVVIRATDTLANESGDTAAVEFERSNCSLDKQIEIKFDLEGSATSVDYVDWAGWYVLIPAGQTKVALVVTPVNDALVEGTETMIFTIRPEPHLTVGSPSTATVMINDDDQSVGLPDFTVTAGQSSVNPGQCTTIMLDIRADITSCTSFGGNADWAGITVTTDTTRNVCPTGTGITYGWRCIGPGGTREQSASVNVNTVGSPTVTLSSNGTSFVFPATVELDAAVNYPGGTINRVEFRDGTSVICTDSTAPYHCTWTMATTGTHSVTAVAYPSSGGSATSNEVTIGVYQSSNEVPCHGLGLYFSNAQQSQITRCTKWSKTGAGTDIAKSTFVDGGIGACAITCYDNTGNTVLPQAVTGVWLQNSTSDVTRWYTTGCARLPWHPALEPDQAGGAWDKLCDRAVTSLSGPPTP